MRNIMNTTRISSKGQVIIPKAFRQSHNWTAGLELIVVDMGDSLMLKPKTPFIETQLDDVAGSLTYTGSAKTQEEIESKLKTEFRKKWHDSN
jgi:AbrB family looped-hinge helix DNA binding protein